ncbi:hypothetical protein D9M71_682610 [compost metagenome]
MGVGHVQVGVGADNAVELAAELQLAAEQASVHLQVFWRLMGEIDTEGLPVRTQQGRTQAKHHTNSQLVGLAGRHRRIGDHLFTNDHHLAGFFNEDRQ